LVPDREKNLLEMEEMRRMLFEEEEEEKEMEMESGERMVSWGDAWEWWGRLPDDAEGIGMALEGNSNISRHMLRVQELEREGVMVDVSKRWLHFTRETIRLTRNKNGDFTGMSLDPVNQMWSKMLGMKLVDIVWIDGKSLKRYYTLLLDKDEERR
jgi:hypothetical protein